MNGKNISISQPFRVTNPDYTVLSETWEVMAVEYPIITFSVTRYWVRDIAYIPISSTDTVVGTVYQENEEGVFIKIIKPPGFDWAEVKVILQEEEATYIFD
jgi:hypothetical protein